MSDTSLVLHEPFTGVAPDLDTKLSPVERADMCRDVLKKTLEIPYKLEVLQGELLYEVTQNKYWRVWNKTFADGTSRPYESFDEYVEKELGFRRRKAYDLIDIYKTFIVELGISSEQLKSISWSKARLVTKVVDSHNADEVLKKIENMTVLEIRGMVSVMKETGTSAIKTPTEMDSLVRVTFQLAPEQAENLAHALEVASTISGSEKPSHNMDLICTDFLSSSFVGGIEGSLAKLDAIKSSVERAFGVRLEVKEMDTSRFERLNDVTERTSHGM